MSQSPEEIRDEIESTRGRLGSDVDALADRVSPSSIAHRQTEKIRGSVGRVREKIMGVADDASEAVHQTSDETRHAIQGLPGNVAQGTRGNPLAAGLIAFGAGLLLSTFVPATETERHAAEAVKEKAQPLLEEAQGMARSVAADLKEPAEEAVQHVKDAERDSAEHLKEEGAAAAGDVKETAQEGKAQVQDAAGDRRGTA
ncbi:hypothetical protein CVS30_16315 [Arthrobacter psychrolactophilus]|uniref:DUF3618 domain-containing protein n=1 Tax=Arthrobacter psychrolactophilus TaxID=92442 RepID=A0A2V5IMD8_9MICC|nr:DUF3618 domain-containing protein [Arthrobacter psychrolactophilus]PYI37281.1 hypothetical protein CVS30_16315 [Arthrobacter psychrolactophilus]